MVGLQRRNLSMGYEKVIVFGATGQVGSAVARNAHHYGAKTVVLAVRDLQKPVPGLSLDEEEKLGFQRFQTDLSKPDTVGAAVEKTGAKSAFIYITHSSSDHMKATIEALKSGGITFVVFLSTNTIRGDLRDVPPDQYIPWAHAQVEINLAHVFGQDGYMAVRPAYFASNAFRWKNMISAGEVRLAYPEAKFDWITSEDMGCVSAAFLAGQTGASIQGRNSIDIYGPELISQRDAIGIIGKWIGKDIKATEVSHDEALSIFVEEVGLRAPLAKYLLDGMKMVAEGKDSLYKKEDASNVKRYAGKEPMTFEEYVKENKQGFGG